MKLTCVTAVFNAIKSGNRENLIRCVRSVAALKTEHEHLIYDGGSTDGTVELLRELEREVEVESRSRRVDGLSFVSDANRSSRLRAFHGNAPTGGRRVEVESRSRREDGLSSVCGVEPCRGGERVDGRAASMRPPRGGESGAREGTRTTGGGESHGIDRRACAEKKVAEWLAGVDEAAFEAALVKLVEEKSAAGEYRFKKPEERELALEGARKFYREFARKIVPLSDGRYVYFAPDERAKTRNASNAISWAEYAFHAVSSSGKLLDGKNFRERLYNRTKAADLPFLEGVIRNEHCMYRLIDAYPENDAVIFIGQDDANGRLEVVTRLDRFGNAEANLGEVTVIAKHKRKENPPPKFRPLTEVVETVAKHQAAGFSPSTTRDSIANGLGSDKGGDEESKVEVEVEGRVGEVEVGSRSRRVDGLSLVSDAEGIPRLRVVSEPDTGIYNALNKGVRDAKGEWFYVLGCDDYICHPEVMDRLIAEAGEADIIATDVFEERTDGVGYRKIVPDATLVYTPYCHQGVIMRLAALRRCGPFDENYRIAADYKLLLKCHIDGCHVSYLDGEKNMFASFGLRGVSESNKELMNREFAAVLSELLNLDDETFHLYHARGYLPLRVLVRFLLAKDRGLRVSSRNMFRNWLRSKLRIPLYPIVVATRPWRYRA